jgi:magnesium-transporting ATPase (P-type)
LSCCHSLIFHQNELIGDGMEKEIFRITQSELKEGEKGEYDVINKEKENFKVLKRFDFSSERQCMSVAV